MCGWGPPLLCDHKLSHTDGKKRKKKSHGNLISSWAGVNLYVYARNLWWLPYGDPFVFKYERHHVTLRWGDLDGCKTSNISLNVIYMSRISYNLKGCWGIVGFQDGGARWAPPWSRGKSRLCVLTSMCKSVCVSKEMPSMAKPCRAHSSWPPFPPPRCHIDSFHDHSGRNNKELMCGCVVYVHSGGQDGPGQIDLTGEARAALPCVWQLVRHRRGGVRCATFLRFCIFFDLTWLLDDAAASYFCWNVRKNTPFIISTYKYLLKVTELCGADI